MEWFRHDSNANLDEKLQEVLLDYGLEGYGLYWYCIELIVGKTSADNITFEVGTTSGENMDPVCFSADKLKEVLVANRGDVGELKVSPDGLSRIEFTGADFESTYWLVMLQN